MVKRVKKEIVTCVVCTDKINVSNRKAVQCHSCNFIACRCCYKRFILESNEIAKCMNCKKEWDYNLVCETFERTFVDTTYKKHLENIFFDKEMALMVSTQPHVERLLIQENMNKELELLHKDRIRYEAMYRMKIKEIRKEGCWEEVNIQNTFVHKCSFENCKGFLSSSWKCNICMNWSCNKCHDVVGKTKNDHICNPDLVATKLLLEKDTKPCPNCYMGITKIDGCNMMFCVECHVAFDWKTCRISTGAIHNPHYFEWRNKGGHVDRDIGDIRCGRGLDYDDVLPFKRRSRDVISNLLFIEISDTIRGIIHTREINLPYYHTNMITDNLDLRIKFMRNFISEDFFRYSLQCRNKATEKKRSFYQILSMFVDCSTEIMYRIFDNEAIVDDQKENCIKEIFKELDSLRTYTNECLVKISNTYHSKRIYRINKKCLLV